MKKHFLSILAIFKNEEMIIKEWLEHHIWQGVEHFYLINKGSDDNYLEIIKPYMDMGIITLYHLPEQFKQVEHYNTIFQLIKNETEWLAVIDIDEYLFGLDDTLINKIIDLNDSYDCIVSYWISFGSNGFDKQPKEIRTSFLERTHKTLVTKRSKCITKTDFIETLSIHVHYYEFKDNIRIVNDVDKILLNHYQLMSKEYFYSVKLKRGAACPNYKINGKYFECKDKMEYFNDETLSNLVKYGYKNK